MLSKIGALSACALLPAILAATPADAAVVIYSAYDSGATSISTKPNSDAARNAFMAAIADQENQYVATFESAALGAFTSLDLGGGATLTGADNGGKSQTIRGTTNCSFSACGANTTAGGKNFLYLNGGTATFTFADPVHAFGAYFTGAQLSGLMLTFNDGTAQSVSVPGQFGADYVGFTDFGREISQITFVSRGDFMAIDDVAFALSPAPEPASWALMILGFGGAGAMLRRRGIVIAA